MTKSQSSSFEMDFSSLFKPLPLGDLIEPTPLNYDSAGESVTDSAAAESFRSSLWDNLLSSADDYISLLKPISSDPKAMLLDRKLELPQSLRRPFYDCEPDLKNIHPVDKALDILSEPQLFDDLDADKPMLIHKYQHDRWLTHYEKLARYEKKYGHCNVPYCYKEEPQLAQWVKRQRHQYKLFMNGDRTNLTEERIELLEEIGFTWNTHDIAWEQNFARLRKFHSMHGHCRVPVTYKNGQISNWMKKQRRQYRLFLANHRSTMTKERISKMESIGFVWDVASSSEESSLTDYTRMNIISDCNLLD